MLKIKNNNSGFTLVELIAVIAILLTITMIAIPSITASIERNKYKTNENKKKLLESAAEIYVSRNKNAVYSNLGSNDYCYISLDSLDVTDSEKKDADGEIFEGCIKFTKSNISYEFADHCETPSCVS